ncbi:MAG TPA: hypothetical protein DCY13_20185 [Verrucomicrobiales bacterium]|nr:hypothetical protein [Verrucomicrobiales bacterium]
MTFKTKQNQQPASTEAELQILVDAAIHKRERFTFEKAPGHSLAAAEYGDDGIILELHRGKKWDGWISSPREAQSARDFFIQYFREPLSASGQIEKAGEWHEVGVFPPIVWLVALGSLLAVVIWYLII